MGLRVRPYLARDTRPESRRSHRSRQARWKPHARTVVERQLRRMRVRARRKSARGRSARDRRYRSCRSSSERSEPARRAPDLLSTCARRFYRSRSERCNTEPRRTTSATRGPRRGAAAASARGRMAGRYHRAASSGPAGSPCARRSRPVPRRPVLPPGGTPSAEPIAAAGRCTICPTISRRSPGAGGRSAASRGGCARAARCTAGPGRAPAPGEANAPSRSPARRSAPAKAELGFESGTQLRFHPALHDSANPEVLRAAERRRP